MTDKVNVSGLVDAVKLAKFDKPGHPFRGNQWTGGGGGGNDEGESSSADERNKRADELREKREKLEAKEEERVNDLKREAKKLVDSEAKVSTKSRGEYVGEVVEVGSKKLTIDVPRGDDDSREIELNWSQITNIEGVSDE